MVNFFAPGEIASNACNISEKKNAIHFGKLSLLGILAGAYIAFGANLATVVGTGTIDTQGFGIHQMLFGAVFSVGLMMVIIGGAELFTGNNMIMMVGALEGCVKWRDVAKNWTIVYFANFVGSLLLVGLIYVSFYSGDAVGLGGGAVAEKAVAIANAKVQLSWIAAFTRGILCNWIVCMAVWLALASKDVIGKIFACMFLVMCFIASGFEHSIANMFFIPIGILINDFSAAEITATVTNLNWGSFIFANLIPVTIGNIVGGAIFVGSSYWYAHLKK
jgi:formate/nitrite transporter